METLEYLRKVTGIQSGSGHERVEKSFDAMSLPLTFQFRKRAARRLKNEFENWYEKSFFFCHCFALVCCLSLVYNFWLLVETFDSTQNDSVRLATGPFTM